MTKSASQLRCTAAIHALPSPEHLPRVRNSTDHTSPADAPPAVENESRGSDDDHAPDDPPCRDETELAIACAHCVHQRRHISRAPKAAEAPFGGSGREPAQHHPPTPHRLTLRLTRSVRLMSFSAPVVASERRSRNESFKVKTMRVSSSPSADALRCAGMLGLQPPHEIEEQPLRVFISVA